MPQDFVTDGQIVLNLSPGSVKGLHMDLQLLAFSARFAGVPMSVEIPMSAIMGIYAKENGQGMIFQQSDQEPDPEPTKPTGPKAVSGSGGKTKDKSSSAKRPSLHVVK